MKAFIKILFIIFIFHIFLSVIFSQKIKSVNKWKYGTDLSTLPDYLKTKSFFSTNHNSQVFANYGWVTHPWYWNHQGTWIKDFSPNFLDVFTTPDTVFLDCRLLFGIPMEKIKSVEVFLAIEGSNRYVFYGNQSQYIPLDGSWKRLYWDMKWAKDFGLTSFYRLQLAFAVATTDSIYVGVEIEADNLGGFYNNPKRIVVYDDFGDITKVSEDEIPKGFVLFQNYPNPFNPTTKIKFSIPNSQFVSLKIYDVLGKEVATLIDAYLAPGIQEYSFNGANLPSGLYIYRLQGQNVNLVKKMMLMK